MTLENVVRKGNRSLILKRLGLFSAGTALALSLYCSDKPNKPENIISSEPVWEELISQSVPEDSPNGTVIYEDLGDQVSYPGEIFLDVFQNDHYTAYFQGKDLLVRDMERDYFGEDSVRVSANGNVDRFLLTVQPVDDPGYWQPLAAQQITKNSPNGTVGYPDIGSRFIDVDSPKNISVIGSNAHFEAYFDNPHIKIRNLDDYFTGQDSVIVLGNGIRSGFLLSITGEDEPATWNHVPNVSCDEDASGSVLLPNVSSFVFDPDSPLEFQEIYNLNDVRLEIQNDTLRAVYLRPDWNGFKQFMLYCNGVPSNEVSLTVLPDDDPTVWNSVPNIQTDEDSPAGTVVLSNLSAYVNDVDSPLLFASTYVLAHSTLGVQGDNLVVNSIEENWSGIERFNLVCNDVSSNDISMTVLGVDDPAYWISDLPAVELPHNPPDGTVVLEDLHSYARDVDSPLQFTIGSQHQEFDLYVMNDAVLMRNVDPDYSGSQDAIIKANGVPTQLKVSVKPPLFELFIDMYNASDVRFVTMTEFMIVTRQNYNLRSHTFPGLEFITNFNIGDHDILGMYDSGLFIYFINQGNSDYHEKMDRASFGFVESWRSENNRTVGISANQNYMCVIHTYFTDKILVMQNSGFSLEKEITLPQKGVYRSVITTDSDVGAVRKYPTQFGVMIDSYRIANGLHSFSDSLPGSTILTDNPAVESRNVFLLHSDKLFRIYDKNTYQVLADNTDWEDDGDNIECVVMNDRYVYLKPLNETGSIFALPSFEKIADVPYAFTDPRTTGFSENYFYGVHDGNMVAIYRINK